MTKKAMTKKPATKKTKPKRTVQTLVIDVAIAAEWKRALKTPAAICRKAAATAFEAVAAKRKPRTRTVELAVVLTSDGAIKRLNALYRGKNKTTDVLSFPAWLDSESLGSEPSGDGREAVLGDVIVARATSARDAKAENKPLKEHLTHLVVHGVLHLLGYDHERDTDARAMERLEISILKDLGIANPYLARPPIHAPVRAGRGRV
jgi:probable rRNA maturation factor